MTWHPAAGIFRCIVTCGRSGHNPARAVIRHWAGTLRPRCELPADLDRSHLFTYWLVADS